MLNREWDAKSNRKLLHLFISSKTSTLVLECAVEDLPLGKNCGLGAWVCSERPVLGQITLMVVKVKVKAHGGC